VEAGARIAIHHEAQPWLEVRPRQWFEHQPSSVEHVKLQFMVIRE
jgi:hypothetical protein